MDEAGVRRVVALANDRHRMTWSLVGRLAGGYSDAGAHELRDANGARAVLKWHAGPIALERALRKRPQRSLRRSPRAGPRRDGLRMVLWATARSM